MLKAELESLIRILFNEWANKGEAPIDKIRYSGPLMGPEEYQSMLDVIFSGWASGGQKTLQAEALLSEVSLRNHSLLVNSGSSANLVAMCAARHHYFKEGDKIATLSCGFPTTVTSIINAGLTPVFCDLDMADLGLNPDYLDRILEQDKKIRGVFYAHTLGFAGQVDEVLDVCRRHDVVCGFDCCDAYGTKYKGKPLQSYGKFSTFSFYSAHHITSFGHCGAISTNDTELYGSMRSISRWGRYCSSPQCCIRSLPNGRNLFCPTTKLTPKCDLPEDYDVSYQFEYLGYNLQTSELQAAVVLEQLKKLPAFDERRRTNYAQLYTFFERELSDFKIWPISPETSPFSFPFLVPARLRRRDVVNALRRAKIESRMLFGGELYKHPAFEKNTGCWEKTLDSHENSAKILETALMLGCSQILDEAQIAKLCECMSQFKP